MRKASAILLVLCMAIVMAEFKGYGQSLLEKLKLPKPPEQTAQHEQTEGAGLPTPSGNTTTADTTAFNLDSPSLPSPAPQQADEAESQHTTTGNGIVSSLDSLNFHEGDFDWRKDWWKALLLTLGGLVAVTILMRIARQLFRYIVLTACLAAGSFGARYFAPPLAPWMESNLPPALLNTLPAIYWSYIATFLVCYILATIVLFILKRPLDIVDKNHKRQSGKAD